MDELETMWKSRSATDVVLVTPTRSLSWSQLDAEARALAQTLRRLGAGDGVGVTPEFREDGFHVVTLVACVLIRAPWCPGCSGTVRLGETSTALDTWPPDALYLMPTSGTSSTPKVVVGSARRTVARLKWGLRWPGRVLARTPLTFVDSIAELLSVFTGRLTLARRADAALEELVSTNSDRVSLTPSILSLALRRGPTTTEPKVVVSSGEPLPSRLVREFEAKHPTWSLVNVWGSTETSADAAFAVVAGEHKENCCDSCLEGEISPIGRSLREDALVRLTDDGLLETVGYSALGYTTEDFGETLQTGDLGERCAQCGALKCLGRRDDVVNVHGRRVNLRNLEASLGCDCCAVVIANEDPARSRLVVFVVGEPNRKVPSYVAVRKVASLPRGPTGKVDKRRLIETFSSDCGRTATTDEERRLDALFADVLGEEPEGSTATLAERGGTSLHAIAAASRLDEALRGLTPVDVLHAPFADLAERLKGSAPLKKRRVLAAASATLKVEWTVKLGACVDAPALSDGHRVFVGSHAKQFVAIDGRTGRVEWETRIGDRGNQSWTKADASLEAAAVFAGDDLVVVGCYDGGLYALRKATGRVAWRYQAEGEIKSAARVLNDGNIVFGCHDGRVHCVDSRGSGAWKTGSPEAAVFGTPAAADGLVIFATTGKLARAVLETTGVDAWRLRTPGPIFASPLVWKDVVVFAGVDGSHLGVDLKSGAPKWGVVDPNKTAVFAAPIVFKNHAVFASNDGTLTTRDPSTGAKVKTQSITTTPIFRSPLIIEDQLVVVDTRGTIHTNPSLSLDIPTYSAAIHNNSIVLGGRDEMVRCIRL